MKTPTYEELREKGKIIRNQLNYLEAELNGKIWVAGWSSMKKGNSVVGWIIFPKSESEASHE